MWLVIGSGVAFLTSPSQVLAEEASSNRNQNRDVETRVRREPRRGSTPRPMNQVIFSGGANFTSPDEWQSAMGEPLGSVILSRFSGEFRRQAGKAFQWGFGVSYLSLSRSSQLSGSQGSYSVTGYGFHLPLVFLLSHVQKFHINGVLSPGFSVDSVSNSNASQVITSANISVFEFEAKLEAIYEFTSSFGVLLSSHYYISKLPVVSTLTQQNQQATPDVQLSSLGFGVGFSFVF